MIEELDRYNITETEKKWQAIWENEKSYACEVDSSLEKYYVLAMFPYPSGKLHMGHVRNYSLSDMVARFKKAQGYNVLNPMGWDAFGLPAENAALEAGANPAEWTYKNIESMKTQLKSMGLALDWDREITTCSPDYYKHEQKMFLEFIEQGLAYQKESWVNWDPVENTVLANEQVVDGKGWRSGVDVERRKLNGWFLKITEYADELLEADLSGWPEKVKIMQEKWIGKSQGLQFKFDIIDSTDKIEVYTTRPDTLFGASFVAIASDHPISLQIGEDNKEVKDFIDECRKLGTSETAVEQAEKKGIDIGLRVKHPLIEGETLPVYIANFVLMDYGTGAVFGCPAHDQRDLDFARKYDLNVIPVVIPNGEDASTFKITDEAYTGDGILGNSEFLNGKTITDAKLEITKLIEDKDQGFSTTTYRLRDWGVSRQRYWGCPIPIIHCGDCGIVPVPDDQLPVELPTDPDFTKPGNPIANHPTWKYCKCPKCGIDAERETDTFDTFFESSWYYARFCDPKNDELGFDKDKANYWCPVDQYVGGIEHAVMHLLYARFFNRALKKCGYLDFDEPFKNLFTQGMITHQSFKDSDGKWMNPNEIEPAGDGKWQKITDKSVVNPLRIEKMSKSKKNVVDPQEILESYGADAARLFVLSDSPPERDVEWTTSGVEGSWRFVNKLWRMAFTGNIKPCQVDAVKPTKFSDKSLKLRQIVHKFTEEITREFELLHFNKVISGIRQISNAITEYDNEAGSLDITESAWVKRESLEFLTIIMAPAMPHIASEIWESLGYEHHVINEKWPVIDKSLLVADTITIAVQVNGKLRATVTLPADADKDLTQKIALEDENVIKSIGDNPVKKVIVVPKRIVNVVI